MTAETNRAAIGWASSETLVKDLRRPGSNVCISLFIKYYNNKHSLPGRFACHSHLAVSRSCIFSVSSCRCSNTRPCRVLVCINCRRFIITCTDFRHGPVTIYLRPISTWTMMFAVYFLRDSIHTPNYLIAPTSMYWFVVFHYFHFHFVCCGDVDIDFVPVRGRLFTIQPWRQCNNIITFLCSSGAD